MLIAITRMIYISKILYRSLQSPPRFRRNEGSPQYLPPTFTSYCLHFEVKNKSF